MRSLALLGAFALLILLALPLAALVLRSGPAALVAGLTHPLVAPALRVSVETSSASLAIIVVTGTPLAWLLARRGGRILAAVEALVQLPIVVPPAVAGVALLLALGRRGLLGGMLGGSVAFTPFAVVLAQVFVSAPFYVQAAAIAFRDLDPRLLIVARTLGASPARTFFRVALPLSAPGLAGGAAMAWARALGEFGATLMFAGNLPGRTQTLPLAIYTALEDDVRVAQALSLVLVAAAAALLVVVRKAAPALTRARTRP
jgi:molybdate transport system permease protein